MKIVSWNLNGLMAVMKSGSLGFLKELGPDVVCFQEIRTQQEPVVLEGYYHYWNHAQQDGYSGTAILTLEEPEKHRPITPSWRHYKLKEYFAQHTEGSITLTFQDIEAIEKRPLPSSARKDRHFWYHRKTENGIAEAWRTEGYSLKRLDMGKEKITLHHNAVGASKLVIPAVLMNGKPKKDGPPGWNIPSGRSLLCRIAASVISRAG